MEHSFSPEQLRRVLGSAEGRQLLALLAAGVAEEEIKHAERIITALTIWILLAGGVTLYAHHSIDRFLSRCGEICL